MPLLEALPFLKGAVARSLPGGAVSKYVFNDNIMYAESASILAAYPIHIGGKFGVSADPLESALKRMPTEPAVSAGDGTLILRSGRLRSELELFEPETLPEANADVAWEPCPTTLWPALSAARPFISKDGSWQRAAWLLQGRVVAMSNVSCIEIQAEGLSLMMSSAGLVDNAVDYLIGLPPPDKWYERGESALWFGWPSGAWVRCPLSSVTMPLRDNKCTFDFVIDNVLREGAVDITADIREAFADAAALGDGTCTLGPEGFVAKGPHDEHHAELPTGCTRDTQWRIPALTPVIEQALEWCPDAHGPAYFSGTGIRGAVVGLSK